MNNVTVQLYTSVDCCKRFMYSCSGLSIDHGFNPQIGDWVRVYHDSDFEIEMQVSERRWKLTNGSNPQLHCWLTKPNGMTVAEFEVVLKSQGFR